MLLIILTAALFGFLSSLYGWRDAVEIMLIALHQIFTNLTSVLESYLNES